MNLNGVLNMGQARNTRSAITDNASCPDGTSTNVNWANEFVDFFANNHRICSDDQLVPLA